MLSTEICGLKFTNPVFTAAGPTVHDGYAITRCAKGGAGGIVCKTVSRVAAKVPRTCMARPNPALRDTMLNVELWTDLPPEAWINGEYQKARDTGLPVIASLGYTAEDMNELVPKIDPLVDAFEFSCHYTNLNDIKALAHSLRSNTKKPIFAKLSPHGYDLLSLADSLKQEGINGFVVMNSLGPCMAINVDSEKPLLGGAAGKGWLSGPSVHPIAVYWVSQLAQRFPDTPIIGAGGVSTGRDAIEFILAGATAVQICTAAIYGGAEVYGKVAREMEEICKKKGVSNVQELRGRALKNLPSEPNLVPRVSCADDSCVHCGSCEKVCIYEAIKVDKTGKKWSVDASKCYGCGLCSTICPKGAIKMVDRK